MCRNKGAPHGTQSPGGSPKNNKHQPQNKKGGRAGYVDVESPKEAVDT